MNTILIPIDFSENASPTYKFATNLGGRETKIQLVFLHTYNDQIILNDSGLNSGLENDTYVNMQLIEEFKQIAEVNMANLKADVIKFLADNELTNYSIKTIVEGGDAGWEITNICNDINPDIIIMGRQGVGKKGILEGSMAKRIMTKATMPVIAVPKSGNDFSSLRIMYASNSNDKDFNKIKLLYKLFKNIPVKIFAVHFHLGQKSNDDIEHINELKDAFKEEMKNDKFHFSLVDTEDKNNALEAFVEYNEINLVAFISHKTNIFKSLFKHEITKNDFFQLGLPMIALHE